MSVEPSLEELHLAFAVAAETNLGGIGSSSLGNSNRWELPSGVHIGVDGIEESTIGIPHLGQGNSILVRGTAISQIDDKTAMIDHGIHHVHQSGSVFGTVRIHAIGEQVTPLHDVVPLALSSRKDALLILPLSRSCFGSPLAVIS